jgi:YspA, cpYpsA-related SLOG family
MKIAIVGSRDFPQLERVDAFVDALSPGDVVVSGGARGVDSRAERRARARGLEVVIIPADWDRHGRSAGFKRNHDIIAAADRVAAFWDGTSRGTAHSIQLARKAGKRVDIFRPV